MSQGTYELLYGSYSPSVDNFRRDRPRYRGTEFEDVYKNLRVATWRYKEIIQKLRILDGALFKCMCCAIMRCIVGY